MSWRSAGALQQGADEELLAAVDDAGDSRFSAFQRAALVLADAYLIAPAEMTAAAQAEVAAELSAEQAVELVLKLTGWSSDKTMVALGLDFEEVSLFTV